MLQKEYNKNEFEKKKLQMEAESLRRNQSTHIKDKFDGSSKDVEEEELRNIGKFFNDNPEEFQH